MAASPPVQSILAALVEDQQHDGQRVGGEDACNEHQPVGARLVRLNGGSHPQKEPDHRELEQDPSGLNEAAHVVNVGSLRHHVDSARNGLGRLRTANSRNLHTAPEIA